MSFLRGSYTSPGCGMRSNGGGSCWSHTHVTCAPHSYLYGGSWRCASSSQWPEKQHQNWGRLIWSESNPGGKGELWGEQSASASAGNVTNPSGREACCENVLVPFLCFSQTRYDVQSILLLTNLLLPQTKPSTREARDGIPDRIQTQAKAARAHSLNKW